MERLMCAFNGEGEEVKRRMGMALFSFVYSCQPPGLKMASSSAKSSNGMSQLRQQVSFST